LWTRLSSRRRAEVARSVTQRLSRQRLIHRAEVIDIEAESYRLKEAKELNAARSKQRGKKEPAQA
jgi:hypothetical protein